MPNGIPVFKNINCGIVQTLGLRTLKVASNSIEFDFLIKKLK